MKRITPFLWFDHQAEEAARFYCGIFPDSRITEISRRGETDPETPAPVLSVQFRLDGQDFIALNGGPLFEFSQAISFSVHCDTQEEIDAYWEQLGRGGEHQRCGWLRDRYGLSWQIVPAVLGELLQDPDPGRSRRATEAMLAMDRLDIQALQRAASGSAQ